MIQQAVNPLCTEASALTWFEFIAARLLDDLQRVYGVGPDGGGPGPWDYRQALKAAQAEHQGFIDAWSSGDPDRIENEWWGLKNIADKWRTHPDFPEPISDGNLQCPVPSPDTGHPCVKPVHRGWTPSEGHGGGHFWKDPKITELEEQGAHFDAGRLLSGQPTPYHLPKDCTPDCLKWRDR
ncbi:hypothetical protein ABZ468_08030 [Streptomyces sp. NPDC005708]|uniref:hypothetical protein n=1 Tax=Streptomyces sp. NPDC005708 TaxID=3154564 RepID=UPI0033E02FCB